MKKKNSIGVNTIFNIIKSCNQIIFPMITFPYISRVLLADNVGKINFGSSVVSYLTLLATLGTSTYAIRECAKVKDDRKKLGNVASEIYSINVVMMVISYIILGVLLIVVPKFQDYRLLILVQSSVIFLNTIGIDWINTAMEDFRYLTIRSFIFQVLSIVLMFVFVRKPEDYIIYALITVISSAGVNITNYFYRKKFCDVKFTFKMNLKKNMPPILTVFSMMLSQTIYCNSDITILGFMKGDHEVGLYSTAVKLYNTINTVIASVAWVVMPQMSYNFEIKNYKEINRLVKYSANFIIVLGLPCVVGINVVCKEIIEIVAGRDYLGATLSLHILSIALLVSLISGLISNIILIPSGNDKICMKASVVSAIVNIIGNFMLIPSFGMEAAAFTTVLSQIVGVLITYKHIDPNVKIEKIGQILRGPILGCVGIIIVAQIVSIFLVETISKFIVTVVLSVAIYAIILLVTKNEFALQMFENVKAKIGGRK